jgi:hypothetical protein
MKRHFVIFYSPGTFVAETTEQKISSWDVKAAAHARHVEEHRKACHGCYRKALHLETV